MRVTVLTLLVALVAAACLGGSPPDVRGRMFLSVSITDGGVDRPLVPGTRVRLVFGGEGRLTAQAGCNTFGGEYRIEGGVLRVDGGAMTEMACGAALDAQEAWVFEFLGSRPALTLAGSDLVLTGGTVVMRLVDREVAEPDLPLVGPTWTVTTVIAGDVASSVPAGVSATLVFAPDGTIQVATGCNTGTARVSAQDGSLRVTELVITERACAEPAGGLERAVLAVLGSRQISYRIEAFVLSLSAGGSGLELSGT